jgi:hypothetical protein
MKFINLLTVFVFLNTNLNGLYSQCLAPVGTVTGTVNAVLGEVMQPSANVVTFEIKINNNTNDPALTFKAYGGGVLGIPAGTTGTLAVTEQPAVNGFAIPNLAPNYNTTAGPGSTPLMRWTSNPTGGTPLIPMGANAAKVAKFTFTRTGGTALPNPITLAWTTGANPPQIVVVCAAGTQTFTAANLGLSLPIELLDFEAKVQGKSNVIEWSTGSERNTAWHVIERSRDGVSNWDQIGKLTAAGTSTVVRNYSLEDKSPLAVSYYRLRAIDYDGSENRSQIVQVTRKAGVFGVSSVYPSPTADQVQIAYESLSETTVSIKIFDFTGRLVLEKQELSATGSNVTKMDMSALQVGIYTIQVSTATEIADVVKVVKQ